MLRSILLQEGAVFDLQHGLRQAQVEQRYRQRQTRAADEQLLDFSANDYLGLSQHPKVVEAAKNALDEWGFGAGAAQLVSGYTEAHEALEVELAEFLGKPRCLLFGNGYAANLGVISALLGRNDAVFEDRINHASLLDAAALSRAQLVRYRHADVADLHSRLLASKAPRKLVASDAVFSMDGDIAPIKRLAEVAKQGSAALMVDDAHGFGVLGDDGQGSLQALGVAPEHVSIQVIAFGKALGGYGAAVLGDEDLIETLIQRARSFIYSTALPPVVVAGVHAALRCLREQPQLRLKLVSNIAYFRAACMRERIPLMESQTPIQPLLVGDNSVALQLSERLRQSGIRVVAIRPPTVPSGKARLRITLSANHSEEDIDRLVSALVQAA